MAGAETDRKDRIIYDECVKPFSMAAWCSDAERYKVARLLKAWGVSNRPARKKRRTPRRKGRAPYAEWYMPARPVDASSLAPLVGASKTGARRATLEDELQNVFNRLARLKKIEDVDDEYTFRPSPRAYISIKVTLMATRKRMGERFPVPRVVTDGAAGLVADWLRGERRVRLRVRETSEYGDYIYYESEDDYDIEPVSNENLVNRLEWLTSA